MDFNAFSLVKYLNMLSENYDLSIHLHDLAGVTLIDDVMSQVFTSYCYHNNPFCNYLKKSNDMLRTCTRDKKVLCWMCSKKNTPFYGSCHMGIEELKYPIKWHGRLIALVCVGQFYTDLEASLSRLEKKSYDYNLDFMECKKLFLDIVKPVNFDVDEFNLHIGILTEYISMKYGCFLISSSKDKSTEKTAERHKQSYIIGQSLNFIRENYMNQLSLKILASNCYCSAPYLSTLFKAHVGTTVTSYINDYRISKAKEQLDITTLPISEIAFSCGFEDSNYFTRVFREFVDMSPTKYRQRKS